MEPIQQAAMCSQTISLIRSFSCGFLDRLTTLEQNKTNLHIYEEKERL